MLAIFQVLNSLLGLGATILDRLLQTVKMGNEVETGMVVAL